jgi:uncharacterized protein (TIGR02145 family)
MNYSKIGVQFVCKMVTLLAFVFAACSENNDPVAGGTVEETGVYAFSNLTGYSMRTSYEEAPDSSFFSSSLQEGYMVRMVELDSVTFDTTENVFYSSFTDAMGVFSFDSVSLNSPYVMLELSPWNHVNWWTSQDEIIVNVRDRSSWNLYRAVVDLRKFERISINVMSSLEASRLLSLVKQGMSYDAAKQQADRDVMDAFGFYNKPFVYEGKKSIEYYYEEMDAVYFVSIFTDYDACIDQQAREIFNANGSFASVPDSIKNHCKKDMSPRIWHGRKDVELDEKDKIMYGNFLSSLYGRGECTAEKEGDSLEIEFLGPELTLRIKCSSGDWSASAYRALQDDISRADGTMTDERDGKTYKTVTFTFNGITQTWMAENLTYSSEAVKPVFDSASVAPLIDEQERLNAYNEYRDVPGWFYTLDSTYWNSLVQYKWYEAMGLDSALVTIDSGKTNFDKVMSIVDSVESEKGYYQGLCPNGWRLPSVNDWLQLIQQCYRLQGYVVSMDEYPHVGTYSFPEIGFGPITIENFVVRPEDAEKYYKNGEYEVYAIAFSKNLKWDWYAVYAFEDYSIKVDRMMNVRCIKQ